MTITDSERKAMVLYRLQQAYETIKEAKVMLDNNMYRAAINRIYYGMFYALLALATENKFKTVKHRQLIGWFNKEFVHTKIVDAKFSKMINIAYNSRTRGDYDFGKDFAENEALDMFEQMKEFIDEIKRLLPYEQAQA